MSSVTKVIKCLQHFPSMFRNVYYRFFMAILEFNHGLSLIKQLELFGCINACSFWIHLCVSPMKSIKQLHNAPQYFTKRKNQTFAHQTKCAPYFLCLIWQTLGLVVTYTLISFFPVSIHYSNI